MVCSQAVSASQLHGYGEESKSNEVAPVKREQLAPSGKNAHSGACEDSAACWGHGPEVVALVAL